MTHVVKKITSSKKQLLRQNCKKIRADGEKRAFIWAYVTKNLPESVEISQSPKNLFPSVIDQLDEQLYFLTVQWLYSDCGQDSLIF